MKTKFYGTVEFLTGQSAAIVELTNDQGEFSGGGRIELPRAPRGLSRDWLYELAYQWLSQSATAKGGRLERMSVIR